MPNGSQYTTLAAGYRGTWVDQLLEAIGAPTTDSNRAALRLWAASEGTLNSNNPLAISGSNPGATTCLAQCGSSSPVYAYGSSQAGVSATANFLQGSNYVGVVRAFRNDAGLSSIWNAINSSPWCAGCQGGFYPVQLAEVVRPGGRAPTSAGAGAFVAGGPQSTAGNAPGAQRTIFGKSADTCAVGEPGIAGIGKFCLLNYGQLQALLGGAIAATGGLIMLVGIGIVVANALPRGNVLQQVAPTRLAGRAVRASGARRAAAARQESQETALARREGYAQRRASERAELIQRRQAGQAEARQARAREVRLRERRQRAARDRERQARMMEREQSAAARRYGRGAGSVPAREEPF